MAGERLDIVEHGQRRRRWVGVAVVVGLVAVPLAGILSGRDSGISPPLAVATPEVVISTVFPQTNAVFPREKGRGTTRTIDVTFPDGTTAEVGYPSGMRLAALGVRPQTSGTVLGEGRMDEFRLLSTPLQGEAEIAAGGSMIRHLTDNVTLWPGPPGVGSAGTVLVFEFGGWRLALQDEREGMTFEQRMAWAKNLRGRVTRDGFLVLSARDPVRLSKPGEIREGMPVGPQLWIGGGTGPLIVLTPTPGCPRKARMPAIINRRPDVFGAVCRGDIHVAVSGEREFVRLALEEVRVRPS